MSNDSPLPVSLINQINRILYSYCLVPFEPSNTLSRPGTHGPRHHQPNRDHTPVPWLLGHPRGPSPCSGSLHRCPGGTKTCACAMCPSLQLLRQYLPGLTGASWPPVGLVVPSHFSFTLACPSVCLILPPSVWSFRSFHLLLSHFSHHHPVLSPYRASPPTDSTTTSDQTSRPGAFAQHRTVSTLGNAGPTKLTSRPGPFEFCVIDARNCKDMVAH